MKKYIVGVATSAVVGILALGYFVYHSYHNQALISVSSSLVHTIELHNFDDHAKSELKSKWPQVEHDIKKLESLLSVIGSLSSPVKLSIYKNSEQNLSITQDEVILRLKDFSSSSALSYALLLVWCEQNQVFESNIEKRMGVIDFLVRVMEIPTISSFQVEYEDSEKNKRNAELRSQLTQDLWSKYSTLDQMQKFNFLKDIESGIKTL